MAVREKRGWAVKDGEYGRQWAIKFLGTRTGRMIFPANSANTLLISFFFFSFFLVVTRLFFFVNDAEGKNKRFSNLNDGVGSWFYNDGTLVVRNSSCYYFDPSSLTRKTRGNYDAAVVDER